MRNEIPESVAMVSVYSLSWRVQLVKREMKNIVVFLIPILIKCRIMSNIIVFLKFSSGFFHRLDRMRKTTRSSTIKESQLVIWLETLIEYKEYSNQKHCDNTRKRTCREKECKKWQKQIKGRPKQFLFTRCISRAERLCICAAAIVRARAMISIECTNKRMKRIPFSTYWTERRNVNQFFSVFSFLFLNYELSSSFILVYRLLFCRVVCWFGSYLSCRPSRVGSVSRRRRSIVLI